MKNESEARNTHDNLHSQNCSQQSKWKCSIRTDHFPLNATRGFVFVFRCLWFDATTMASSNGFQFLDVNNSCGDSRLSPWPRKTKCILSFKFLFTCVHLAVWTTFWQHPSLSKIFFVLFFGREKWSSTQKKTEAFLSLHDMSPRVERHQFRVSQSTWQWEPGAPPVPICQSSGQINQVINN